MAFRVETEIKEDNLIKNNQLPFLAKSAFLFDNTMFTLSKNRCLLMSTNE
ncbi:Uncharacterised protein [Klebsiella variicola]|nr:Uncharacterised protein [Klebsiella variicola]